MNICLLSPELVKPQLAAVKAVRGVVQTVLQVSDQSSLKKGRGACVGIAPGDTVYLDQAGMATGTGLGTRHPQSGSRERKAGTGYTAWFFMST